MGRQIACFLYPLVDTLDYAELAQALLQAVSGGLRLSRLLLIL